MVRRAGRRVAGVELGGTKCLAVLASEDGEVLEQRAFATTLPGETLSRIAAQLKAWWSDEGFTALGIASFGPIDLDRSSSRFGSILTTAKSGWCQVPVLSLLRQDLPVPVGFDTDVNGAAFAEGRWGAAQGMLDYAYVTVGTGVGVGLIVNGAATRGLLHCEAGHMRVARLVGDDWPGVCPYHGDCVEGLAAGPAISARAGRPGEELHDSDPVWDTVIEALAQMAQALIATTGPRRLLLGGGVLGDRPALVARIDDRVRSLIAGYLPLPPVGEMPPLVSPPGLGAAAGPLGPIALALGALDERNATTR